MKKPHRLSFLQRTTLAFVFLILVLLAGMTGRSLLILVQAQRALQDAHRNVKMVETLFREVLNAETGQRGYLLAGTATYLRPYYSALSNIHEYRRGLVQLPLDQKASQLLQNMLSAVDKKLDELARTIAFSSTGENTEAFTIVKSGQGLELMDEIRKSAEQFTAEQEVRIDGLSSRYDDAIRRTYVTTAFSLVSSISLLIYLVLRTVAFARRTWANEADLRARNEELLQLTRMTSEHNDHMQKLSELIRFLQSSQDATEAHDLLAERLPSLLKARTGALYLMAPSRNQLQLAFKWGSEPYIEFFEPNECWALRGGQPYAQPEGTGATACRHLQESASLTKHGLLCVPMASHGELSGLVVLEPTRTADGRPESSMEPLWQTTLEQVSLSLGNLRLRESLRQQSIKDTLTGLYNRRFLDESLRREILRSQRRGLTQTESAIAVLMIDVDHFKNFNDKFGHKLGDAVLRNVALALVKNVRSSDLVARFGGEEFTVLLPSTVAEAAAERAQVLLEAVAAMEPIVDKENVHHPVTISIGVACLHEDGDTAEELIHNADKALYRSKRDGRNRVTLFKNVKRN
jgi:diguanylate cyclase (GGDEF)-like protein